MKGVPVPISWLSPNYPLFSSLSLSFSLVLSLSLFLRVFLCFLFSLHAFNIPANFWLDHWSFRDLDYSPTHCSSITILVPTLHFLVWGPEEAYTAKIWLFILLIKHLLRSPFPSWSSGMCSLFPSPYIINNNIIFKFSASPHIFLLSQSPSRPSTAWAHRPLDS